MSRDTPITRPDAALFQPYEDTSDSSGGGPVEAADPVLVLQQSLGSGRTDPFSTLPVELGSGTHALLDHCKFGPRCNVRSVIDKRRW